METKLKTIFSYVNNWLRFAEEKNAALIVLNGALLLALISLMGKNVEIPSFIHNNIFYYRLTFFYLLNFVLFSAFGLMISLISFLPQTKVIINSKEEKIKDSDNLIFYSHIAKYDADKYLSKLHNILETESSKYELAYANQIITNSKIAAFKYLHFQVALWLTISSIFTPIIGYILFLQLDATNKINKIIILIIYLFFIIIFHGVIY